MRSEPFCPVDELVNLIGSRSTLLILRELFGGAKRTGDLLNALDISSATLLEKLRLLESLGVLRRTTYAEAPPRVEYELTDKGLELQPVMAALREVGARWHGKRCATAEVEHAPTCLPCRLNEGRRPADLRPAAVGKAAVKRSDVFLL